MDILIKGMDEIPEDGAVLVVKHDNGKAYIKHACMYGYSMELVKLPAAQPATNCSEIPNGSDDTISRQAAVDVVDFECGEWRGLAKTIIKKLEALPAVQPVAKDINVLTNDCIIRQMAIDALENTKKVAK